MYIDTHAHLWFNSYHDDLDQVLERAKAERVEKVVVPGTDILSSKKAIELAKTYPKVIYAAAGIHPEEVLNRKSQDTKVPNSGPESSEPWDRSELRTLIAENRDQVVAIGRK
jgi:Mg-dependent DNase